MVISAPVILKLNICLWSLTHWHQAFPLCQKWPHKGIEAAWINRKVSWRNLGRLKSTPVCKACLGALSPLNFWEWQFLILYRPNRRWSPLTVRDDSCISSQSTAVSCSSEGWVIADLLYFFLMISSMFILCAFMFYLHVCIPQRPEEGKVPGLLELELQAVVYCHMDARNQVRVFCRSSKDPLTTEPSFQLSAALFLSSLLN